MRASKEHSRSARRRPRYGRYGLNTAEEIKAACKTTEGIAETIRIVKTGLKKLTTLEKRPQMDALNAFASFDAALTELLHPKKAKTPKAPPTLRMLIRDAVTEDFVEKHLPAGATVKAMGKFLAHLHGNVAAWLSEEYNIKSEADMCIGDYDTPEAVSETTNIISKRARHLVAHFAKNSKGFAFGDEGRAAVTAVLEAAVQECVPAIWLFVWNEVIPSTVFSLQCTVYG